MKTSASIKQIRKWAEEATAKWLSEHSDQKYVERTIHDLFDQHLRDITLNLMGLERSFDRWRIDMSRRDEKRPSSNFPDWLVANAETAAKTVLAQIFLEPPVLSKVAIEAIKQQYREQLNSNIRRAVYRKAEEDAGQIFGALADEVLKEMEMEVELGKAAGSDRKK